MEHIMDDLTQAVLREVVVPLIVALISAFAAWLVTKLPGPLRDWLASGTHKRDLELILGAEWRWRPGTSPQPRRPMM
jgi:hypothetical protein